MTEILRIDEGEGADWIKAGVWNLHGIETAEALRAHLAANGVTVEHFKTLPVYRANVARFAWLEDL